MIATRQFQFTPLREGRHVPRVRRDAEDFISIHAPPRGATLKNYILVRYDGISIHAPPRGATCPLLQSNPLRLEFQFTPLREGRRVLEADALTIEVFQFTPLREGRRAFLHTASIANHFNSRPSARGDCAIVRRGLQIVVFQFTPLREGRQSDWEDLLKRWISIHAPPRGATTRLR